MHTLGIDIETFSSISLMKAGVYRYVEAEDFQILLLSYSLDGAEPICFDLFHNELPSWFVEMLFDEDILKTAWNAPFEMICISKHVGRKMDPTQWECTMIKASMCGYSMSLDLTSKAMGLVEKKDPVGKALIKYFSEPCSGKRIIRERNYPHHDPGKWTAFKGYNKMDVVVEQAISKKLCYFKISEQEQKYWRLDQKINERGVKIDRQLVENAIQINQYTEDRLVEKARTLTGIANPRSTKQILEWIREREPTVVNLQKQYLKEIIPHLEDISVKKLLRLRQELSKSSTKKYGPMLLCMGADFRARGLLQFYGANKTGRWSSRLIQIQNLVKNKLKDLDLARRLARDGIVEDIELLFGNVPDTMSQLCRTAFVAREGTQLLVDDLAAIEARIIAWFADETWRLKVFEGDGLIYEASGAKMFKVPVEEVKGDLRFKAKTAELALGFQGGVGAIVRMEEQGLKTGILPEERQDIVNIWRAENPNIVKLWYACDNAAVQAVENPGQVIRTHKLEFFVKHQTLWIKLPSGRYLAYVKPHLKEGKFGRMQVNYWGVDQETKKWCHQDTYGGKIVENVVQGTARDVLAWNIDKLESEGFEVVMHIHDEIVAEVPLETSVKKQKRAGEIMSQNIPWAVGLPIREASYLTPYYLKDS
jgi:DNA polymerase bacteriophage-type